jgi:hypothetical protein
MTVYIDDAFTQGDWGRWNGGGHLQADVVEELHQFAARLGLKRGWFQCRPGRPELDHYDLTRGKRELALRLGAVAETAGESARRMLTRIHFQAGDPATNGSRYAATKPHTRDRGESLMPDTAARDDSQRLPEDAVSLIEGVALFAPGLAGKLARDWLVDNRIWSERVEDGERPTPISDQELERRMCRCGPDVTAVQCPLHGGAI